MPQLQHIRGHQPARQNSLPACLSLTNLRKRRFAAGALKGPFPVSIQHLDSCMESEIISALCKELNDSYCLSLPAAHSLDLSSESPMLELNGKRVVVIGCSHTGQANCWHCWQLPHQSQTPEAAEVGCPLISLGSETKRNESENERSEIAKKKVSFACFDLKRNGIFWMRNEMIRSEKYRKYRKYYNENQ